MSSNKVQLRRKITEGAVARAQLLDAAEQLFYSEGTRNVGVEAVAKAAGAHKMSLYRQFESKDALLKAYLERRDEKFWSYFEASVAKHPDQPKRQLQQIFVDLAKRASAPDYRGCPFVNVAVEFPDRDHLARQMVADTKARLLKRLTVLTKAAGAKQASTLAKSLALLIEGAYAASQTYGTPNPVLSALPKAADTLIAAMLKANH